jgi:hypothetical protein
MAAATNNLLLTTYDLDENALDLNILDDADANMTPVADGATGNTFRFTNTKRTFVLLRNAFSAAVTFTIAAVTGVKVSQYGEQDMAAIAISLAAGDATKQYGIISVPAGYGEGGIVTVTVSYAGSADDGTILAGAFRLTN